jgi:YVTN family beta-propeller protein
VLTPDGATLFVVNADSGSVSAINTRTDEKTGEVYVGKDPHNLVLSPDGTRLYVVCQGSATLVTLDTETFTAVAKLRISAQPYDAVTDLSGDFLYVSSTAGVPTEMKFKILRTRFGPCNSALA